MDRHGNGEEFLLDKAFNIVTKELSFKGLDKNLFTGILFELWKASFLLIPDDFAGNNNFTFLCK